MKHSATLPRLSLEEAQDLQFRLVNALCNEFSGEAWLNRGELGVGRAGRGAGFTRRAERALARMFSVEDAVLVSGAGTGAIRAALASLAPAGSPVMVHRAPIYPTTAVTFRMAGYTPVVVDLHNEKEIADAFPNSDIRVVYIQHTRQDLADHYELEKVIRIVRATAPNVPIVVDDNYAVANTPRIGVELGADVSAFSAFKLLGPEGVGIVLGRTSMMDRIRVDMYSGGTRVQGHQAQDTLIGLTQVFVLNAIAAETAYEVVEHLNKVSIHGIQKAFVANLQSPVILVRMEKPVADKVISEAETMGALPFPVGAMSRYELAPLFYRVSSTMKATLGEEEAAHWVRIGPMRSGPDTILSILIESLKRVG